MYLEHFELKEAPFSITPDPRFVFLTAQHRDAMAHLLFGISQGGGGGFVQLTGEVGTGKTTLCRLLMAQVPDNVRIALVLNPMQQPIELLRTICDELRILLPRRNSSIKILTDALTRYLLESYAAGLRVVVVLDEAQNLSFEALEQVRLLTNLETPTQKLLQIILLGQPELRDLLARQELRQLAQRITARYHLAPLSREDTHAYVGHRLAVAGRRRPLFTVSALDELHRRTRGFPRSINVVADRALLGAFARSEASVGPDLVRVAAAEVAGDEATHAPRRWAWPVAALAVAGAAVAFWQALPARPDAVAEPAQAVELAPVEAQEALRSLDPFAEAIEAVKVLAGWWATPAPESTATCNHPQARTLCAELRLNEALLRRLDRPLALELRQGSDRRWYALRRWTGNAAQLAGPKRLARVDWAEIAPRWLGDAWLVVPRPGDYAAQVITVGSEGPWLPMVRVALENFDGRHVEHAGYDLEASLRVRALQDQFGLAADGLIGPETMALLAAFAADGLRLDEHTQEQAFVSEAQQ
jgi:general secretion pathway protein A